MTPRGLTLRAAVGIALVATVAWPEKHDQDSARGSETLRVCLPSDDAPRSSREQTAGIDVEVARLLANALARPLTLVWLPDLGEIDEVSDLNFRPLLGRQCDMHLSVPGSDGLGWARDLLALSVPYYGAAYELIPHDAAWQWGDPVPGTVAVAANSVAHVAIDAAGMPWSMRRGADEIERALATGEAALGLVWGPNLGSIAAEAAANFAPPAVLRWNLHAAVRRGDALLADLNAILGDETTKVRVGAILARHNVPPRPPFDSVYSPEALRAITGL